MHKSLQETQDRVFVLTGYRKRDFKVVLITPEAVAGAIVLSAWAYAIKHTAKSLEEADHDAALKLLLERHPRWLVIPTLLMTVEVELATAENDIPES